jgi:hypothetical protein
MIDGHHVEITAITMMWVETATLHRSKQSHKMI